MPTEFTADSIDKHLHTFPSMAAFKINYLLVVREDVADILRKFDLGNTSLHPLQYVDSGRGYNLTSSYFFVNMAERRHFVVPLEEDLFYNVEGSEFVIREFHPLTNHTLPVERTDDEIPALWRDARVPGSIFARKDLAVLLKQSGLTDAFDFIDCRDATAEDLDNKL